DDRSSGGSRYPSNNHLRSYTQTRLSLRCTTAGRARPRGISSQRSRLVSPLQECIVSGDINPRYGCPCRGREIGVTGQPVNRSEYQIGCCAQRSTARWNGSTKLKLE